MAAEAVEGTTTGKSTRTRLFRKNKNTAVPPAASVDSSPREGAARVPPPEQAARDDVEPEGKEGDVADLQRNAAKSGFFTPLIKRREPAPTVVAGKNKPSSKQEERILLDSFDREEARTESKESSKIRLFKRKEPAPSVTPSSPRESGTTRVRLFKKSAPAPERVSCDESAPAEARSSDHRKEQSRTSNAAVVAPAAGAASPEIKAKEKIRLFPKKAAAGAPEGESRGAGSAGPIAVETGVDDDWRGPVVTWVGASGPNFADQQLQQREQSMEGEGDSYLAACFDGLNDLARDVCGLSHENVRSPAPPTGAAGVAARIAAKFSAKFSARPKALPQAPKKGPRRPSAEGESAQAGHDEQEERGERSDVEKIETHLTAKARTAEVSHCGEWFWVLGGEIMSTSSNAVAHEVPRMRASLHVIRSSAAEILGQLGEGFSSLAEDFNGGVKRDIERASVYWERAGDAMPDESEAVAAAARGGPAPSTPSRRADGKIRLWSRTAASPRPSEPRPAGGATTVVEAAAKKVAPPARAAQGDEVEKAKAKRTFGEGRSMTAKNLESEERPGDDFFGHLESSGPGGEHEPLTAEDIEFLINTSPEAMLLLTGGVSPKASKHNKGGGAKTTSRSPSARKSKASETKDEEQQEQPREKIRLRTEGDESNDPARGAAPAEAAEEQMRTPRTSPRGLPQRTSWPDETKMKPRDVARSRSPASSKKVTLNKMSHEEQQAQALLELLDSKVRKLLPKKLPHSKAYRHKQPIRPSAAENVNAERRSSRSSGGRMSGGSRPPSSTLEVDEFLEAELKQQREELQRMRSRNADAASVALSSDMKSSASARSGSFIDDLMRRHAPGSEVAVVSQRKISDAPPVRAGTAVSAGAPGSRTSAETSTKKKSEQLLLPSSIYEEDSGESIPAMVVITEKARSQSAIDRRPAPADALDPADEDNYLRITTISNYRRSAGVVEAGSRRLSSRLSQKNRKFLSTQREQRVHDRATWRSERRGRRSPEDHRSRSSKRTSEGGGDVDTSELDEDIRSLLARGEKENKPRKSERTASSGGGSADLLQVAQQGQAEEEEEDQAQPPRRSPSTGQLLQTAERQSRQLQEVLDRIAEQQEALRQSQQQEHQERASGNTSAAGGAGGLAGRAYSGTRGPSLSLDEHLQGSEPEHDIAGRASLRRSFPANDWRAPQLESISIGGGGGPEVVGSSDPGGGDVEPDRRGYPSIAMPRLSSNDSPVAPPSDSLLPGAPAGPVARVPSMMVVDAVPKLPSMMVVDAAAKVPSVMVPDHSAYGSPAGGDEGNINNLPKDNDLLQGVPDWAESMAKAEAQLVAARKQLPKDTPKKVGPSGYTRARTAERASKDPRPMTRNVAALDHLHFHPEDHYPFHFKREGPPPAPQKQRAQPKTSSSAATAATGSHPLRGLLTPRGFARGEAYLRSLTPKQHQNPVDYDLNGRRVEVGHVNGNSKKPRRVMQWPQNDSELGLSRPGPRFPLRSSRDEPDSRPRTPRSARDLEGNVIREVAPAWSRHFGARGAPIEHGGMLSSSSPYDRYHGRIIRGGGGARSTTPRSGRTPRRNGDPTAATGSPGRIMNRVNMLEGKRRGRTKTPGRPMRVESAAPKTLNAERKQRLSIGMPGGQLQMLSPDRATETDRAPTQETNDVGVFVFPGARLVAPGERSKSLAVSQAGDAAARASENKEENSDAALENDDIAAAGYGNSNSATDVVDALRSDAVAPLLLEDDDAASATPSTPVSATGGENDGEKERKQVISSPMNTISTRPSAAADNYFSLSSPDVSPQMSHAMPRDDVKNDDQDDRTESSKHSHFHELSSSEEEEELPQGADVGAGASAEREEIEKDVFVDPEQGQAADGPQPDQAQSDPDAAGDGDEDLPENGPIVVLAPKLAPRKAPAKVSVKRNRSPSVKAEEHHASVHHEDDVQFADHTPPPEEKVGSFPQIEDQPSEYRGSGVARRSSKKDLAEQVPESGDLPGVPSGNAPKKTKASKTPLISRLSDTTTGNQPRREQKSRAAPSERESVNGRNSGSSASKKKLSTTAGDRPSRSTTAVRPGSDSRSGSGTSSSQQAMISVPKARGLAKQDKGHADFKALPRGRRVSNSSAAENETGGQLSPRPEFWSHQLSPRGVFTPKHQYKDDLAKFQFSSMRSPRGLSSKSPPPLSKSTSIGGAPIAVAPALSNSRRGSRAATGRGSAPRARDEVEAVLHHSAADMGHTDDGICHQACFMADEHLIQQHHDRHDFVHGAGASPTSGAAEAEDKNAMLNAGDAASKENDVGGDVEDERSMASLLEIRLKEENDQLNAATQGTSAQVHRDTHVDEKRALDSILAQENANLQLSLMGDQELVQLEKSVRTQSSSIQLHHEKDEDSRGVTDVSPRGAADLDAGGGTPEKQISGTSSSSGSGASGLSADEASSIRDKFVEASIPAAAFPETAAGDRKKREAREAEAKRLQEENELELASLRIQSRYRGGKARAATEDKKQRLAREKEREQREAEAKRRVEVETRELVYASLKIQSRYRGGKARTAAEDKKQSLAREKREREAEAKRLQEEKELVYASLKIQSRYRGGKARVDAEDKKRSLAREKREREAEAKRLQEEKELVHASLKIQTRYRGGKARAVAEEKKQRIEAEAKRLQEEEERLERERQAREAEAQRLQEEEERLEREAQEREAAEAKRLQDQEQQELENSMSLKIQSRYRGGKARADVEDKRKALERERKEADEAKCLKEEQEARKQARQARWAEEKRLQKEESERLQREKQEQAEAEAKRALQERKELEEASLKIQSRYRGGKARAEAQGRKQDLLSAAKRDEPLQEVEELEKSRVSAAEAASASPAFAGESDQLDPDRSAQEGREYLSMGGAAVAEEQETQDEKVLSEKPAPPLIPRLPLVIDVGDQFKDGRVYAANKDVGPMKEPHITQAEELEVDHLVLEAPSASQQERTSVREETAAAVRIQRRHRASVAERLRERRKRGGVEAHMTHAVQVLSMFSPRGYAPAPAPAVEDAGVLERELEVNYEKMASSTSSSDELSDIETVIEISIRTKKVIELVHLEDIRTMVHGYEGKTRVGGLGRILRSKPDKNWVLLEIKRTGEKAWVPGWCVSKGFFKAVKGCEKGVCDAGDIIEYLKGPVDGRCQVRNVTKRSNRPQWLSLSCLPPEAEAGDQHKSPSDKKEPVRFFAYHDYKSKDGKVDVKKGAELQVVSVDPEKGGWVKYQIRFLNEHEIVI
eukprot:g8542.t1